MAYDLIVKEEAQVDALEAYLYYEARQEGLGERFLDNLIECYKKIRLNPQHYSYIYADKEKTLRDLKIKTFPYVVIYDIIMQQVIVYAVHNCYKNEDDLRF